MTVKEIVWGIDMCVICVAHVNKLLYWSCHLEISLLWLPMLIDEMDRATETCDWHHSYDSFSDVCASCIMYVGACMFTCTYSWLPL